MNLPVEMTCLFCQNTVEVHHVHEVKYLHRVGCSICGRKQFSVSDGRPRLLSRDQANVAGRCEVAGCGVFACHVFLGTKMCEFHFGDAVGKRQLGMLGQYG